MSVVFDPADHAELIDTQWVKDDITYTLRGILYASDDWYWLMMPEGVSAESTLLSCVMSIQGYGFERASLTQSGIEALLHKNHHLVCTSRNILDGLQIINKYFDSGTAIFTAAEKNIIYSVGLGEIIKADFTYEDLHDLELLGWIVKDDMLACRIM